MTKKPIQYAMIDAFTDTAFKGNPAAVCLLEEKERFDDDEWLQSVAREFNAPATAFLTRVGATESEDRDSLSGGPSSRFQLRWFTPVAEVCLFSYPTRRTVDDIEAVIERPSMKSKSFADAIAEMQILRILFPIPSQLLSKLI